MARSWHGLPLAMAVVGLAAPPLLAPLRAEAQLASEPQLRVLLQEGPAITVAALDGGGLRVRDRQGRVLQDLTIAAPPQLHPAPVLSQQQRRSERQILQNTALGIAHPQPGSIES